MPLRGLGRTAQLPALPVKCLTCEGAALTRGICGNCYRSLTRRIKKGKVASWAAAVAAGLCLESRR